MCGKKIISLAIAFSLTFSVVSTAKAEELNNERNDITDSSTSNIALIKNSDGIQALVSEPDTCEPNDTQATAFPYSNVEDLQPTVNQRGRLWTLGMKNANLDSATDEDWYSIHLEKGVECFADLRNIGRMNWYIEIIYPKAEGGNGIKTSDPSIFEKFLDHPEKYISFTPEVTGTHYIRITSGNDWREGQMDYFFYVGPKYKNYKIANLPVGGFKLSNSYKTLSFNLSDTLPSQSTIIDLQVWDKFSGGQVCDSVDKYLTYEKDNYTVMTSGTHTVNKIAGQNLTRTWTLGAKCSHNGLHSTNWTALLNGWVKCRMEPYPGN